MPAPVRMLTKERADYEFTDYTKTAADEEAIRAIHQRMIDAWNAGDAVAFAAPFTDEANFVAFEGTHLKGAPRDHLIPSADIRHGRDKELALRAR